MFTHIILAVLLITTINYNYITSGTTAAAPPAVTELMNKRIVQNSHNKHMYRLLHTFLNQSSPTISAKNSHNNIYYIIHFRASTQHP